jgi:ComF family protein
MGTSAQPAELLADGRSVALLRLARLLGDALGELLAPTRCAACDEVVGARVVFCGACAPSVVEARDPSSAVFSYGGAVATAIVLYKYAGRSDLAARFGALMAQRAVTLAGRVDLVVPVPLHPRRLVERGFDQAALLAAPVARALGAAYAPRAVERVRDTPKQASLERAARAANVASAFRCASPRLVEGRRVLLVDDVLTTGATLASCARALGVAGARSVSTLVLAQREHDQNVQDRAERED